MRVPGQQRLIVDSPPTYSKNGRSWVYRSAYVDEVEKLMKRSKGPEPPGTFNPSVISEPFAEQCKLGGILLPQQNETFWELYTR
ncbi:hypothetical protein J3458_020946 [Metarhizium acridum]|uniref:uncharacterized protein n=1 Tax=Metarhizium acridum TaxID=92637 RepID=UPI001C6AC50A|nr:hypothetical protein J3458_020946 [Metarhizium acridum]